MQSLHHSNAEIVLLAPRPSRSSNTEPAGGLSPAAMARHLLAIESLEAKCFALEMEERTAWANAAWGEFWRDVARLV